MIMKEIKAYKLSDGTIVESEEEAMGLERELLFISSIKFFSEEHISYNDYQESFSSTVTEYKEEIYSILKNYFENPIPENLPKKDVLKMKELFVSFGKYAKNYKSSRYVDSAFQEWYKLIK